jgi:antitoxin HicB
MTAKTSYKRIDEYLALPYTIEVVRDNAEGWSGLFAKVVELPGCMTQATHFEELGEMIEDAMRAWLEAAIEEGIPIPEPRPQETYSGKFVVRVPRSLHHEIADAAKREGVSLNAYVNTALAKAVGHQPVLRDASARVSQNLHQHKAAA